MSEEEHHPGRRFTVTENLESGVGVEQQWVGPGGVVRGKETESEYNILYRALNFYAFINHAYV